MHIRRHHWIVLTLATVVFACGCRGTRPHDSMVQVTQQNDLDVPDVKAPEQRLAVNKSRRDGDSATRSNRTSDQRDSYQFASDRQKSDRPDLTRTASFRDDNPHNSKLAGDDRTPRSRPSSDTTVSIRFDDGTEIAATQEPLATTHASKTPVSTAATENTVADRAEPAAADTAEVKTPEVKNAVSETAELKAGKANATELKTAAYNPSEGQAAEAKTAEVKTAEATPVAAKAVLEMTVKELAEKFQNDRAALVADLRQVTATTMQPESVEAAIADAIKNLPVLPPETGVPPALSSHRMPAPKGSSTPVGASNLAGAHGSVGDGPAAPEMTAGKTVSPGNGVVQAGAPAIGVDATPLIEKTSAQQPAVDPIASQLSDQRIYAELLKRLSAAPADESDADRSSRLIKQRHLMVLSGDPDGAVAGIDAMSVAEQEFLRHQLLGLWTMVDPHGHPVPSRRFTTALPEIREATKFAAAATHSLEVRSLAFCTAIESYGQIKTFPGNRFESGQQVILYCEIENFTVNKTSEGYETYLQGSYDIYNADNEKVVSQLLPADKQISSNYLRDYFIAYQMHLPQQLPVGTYRLQLTMEDASGKENGGVSKYGQGSIPLVIAK